MDQREHRDRRRNQIGVLLAVVLVVGFGLSRVLPSATSGPAPDCDEAIIWNQAADVVGDLAAVIGPVASVSFEPDVGGSPTFLNMGHAHPDPERFDVVVYQEVREAFAQPPDDSMVRQQICVRGQVRDRDGVPQIILHSPDQISSWPP